ncbi:MAG: helix-hairpin-helix domain-containing protein [Bacteroidales bacterium]|nr:helix-hairpin-helix domain-containing protein [Bacteroidales bacterium]
MLSKIKHLLLPFFSLNKSEQHGILALVILILLMVVVNLVLPFVISPEENKYLNAFKADILTFKLDQKSKHDSIYIEEIQNSGLMEMEIALQKINPFAFDPNKLPDEIWLKLGFTPHQVKTIKNYEAKGGKFYRKEDVKKLYCISDAEYQILEPFIQIKSPYQTKPPKETSKWQAKESKQLLTIEINQANPEMLINNLGLNSWLAKRVSDYGELLGGYYSAQQLAEVYGMKPEVMTKILPFVTIDTLLIRKIDLNTISFKELLHHPYFDYETTKSILETRTKIKSFSSPDQLLQIPTMTDSLFKHIVPYIVITDATPHK